MYMNFDGNYVFWYKIYTCMIIVLQKVYTCVIIQKDKYLLLMSMSFFCNVLRLVATLVQSVQVKNFITKAHMC